MSPISLIVSKSRCGKYCAPPTRLETADENHSDAGSKTPSCCLPFGSCTSCPPADRLSGQRIINGDPLRQQFGEVAGAHFRGGHGGGHRFGKSVWEPFERGEEERAVLHNRSANRSAGTLVPKLRLRLLRTFQEE